MTTYYVRADGSDSNTGLADTAGAAWLTLNKACTVATGGDTIYISDAGGVFSPSAPLTFKPVGSIGNVVTITNAPGDSPIFDGTSGTYTSSQSILQISAGSTYADIGGFMVRNNPTGRGLSIDSSTSPSKANHITIRDVVIHDIFKRGLGGAGEYITVTDCEIYNCVLENEGELISGWAAAVSTFTFTDNSVSTNWTFTDCYIHNNWGEGITALRLDTATFTRVISRNNYSNLFYIDKARHLTYDRCWAIFDDDTYLRAGNKARAWSLSAEATGIPVPDFSPANLEDITIKNCLMMRTRGEVFYDYWTPNTSLNNTYKDIKIYNCSAVDTDGAGFNFEDVPVAPNTQPSGCEFRNCITYGTPTENDVGAWTFTNNDYVNGIPGAGTHTNCIAATPNYKVPSTSFDDQNLTLNAGSPCIAVGITGFVTEDYNGVTRPNPPAIGAFEFVRSGGAGRSRRTFVGLNWRLI